MHMSLFFCLFYIVQTSFVMSLETYSTLLLQLPHRGTSPLTSTSTRVPGTLFLSTQSAFLLLYSLSVESIETRTWLVSLPLVRLLLVGDQGCCLGMLMGLFPPVLDNGTGYTKMGFAGNSEPSFVMPTTIATRSAGGTNRPAVAAKPASLSGGGSNMASKRGIEDLDFYIGNEAHEHAKSYNVDYPIRHGIIDNWDHMERCTVFPPA